MRGVVFRGDRRLELLPFEDPSPGLGEAVIAIKASGLCGSDLHFYRGKPNEILKSMGLKDLVSRGMAADAAVIAGHEPCGVIEALGSDVDSGRFKVGDRVLVFHYKGCNYCDSCRTGWTQLCDQAATVYGVTAHGGHAEYMKLPVSSLIHMPDEISFVGGAAISCGTGTAYGALLRLDISARDMLAIFGLGPVGLSAAQLASGMGVEVIGVDVSPSRVERSKQFGVLHAIDASKTDAVEEVRKLTGGHGVTCAIDCAGGEAARLAAIRCTSKWGKIALVAVGGNLNVEAMSDVIRLQRTIIGSYTFSLVGMKQCAHFIASHGVEVDKIFTDFWKLEQAEEAYRDFDRQTGGKAVFQV